MTAAVVSSYFRDVRAPRGAPTRLWPDASWPAPADAQAATHFAQDMALALQEAGGPDDVLTLPGGCGAGGLSGRKQPVSV
ncbi:glutamate-ammonia-ligase adenylyltransferase [Acetobacter malorum]|uniref:Glutamate-ammonia-ligase adenylyltransferase n=1 Tax=Acetobacter malorum TaxID=178901 RepID=A0A177GA22_9PROT|nr:glutamate-ammonia-ligase adenylyltransferase [Acetobacter malorum]